MAQVVVHHVSDTAPETGLAGRNEAGDGGQDGNTLSIMLDSNIFRIAINEVISASATIEGEETEVFCFEDGATISSDVLVKICTALECTMNDIVEIVPNNK